VRPFRSDGRPVRCALKLIAAWQLDFCGWGAVGEGEVRVRRRSAAAFLSVPRPRCLGFGDGEGAGRYTELRVGSVALRATVRGGGAPPG